MIEYLKTLNENQYKAVTTESQYVRIVAGAGSGKTRVLTYRIAYLVEQFGVRPWNILAITFTNKVAKEMKERTLKLLDVPSNQINISTFHSFCARFLRRQINLIGYPSNYSILDSDDQEKIIKDIGVELGYKRSDKIISNALNYIADKKCAGIYPGDIVIKGFNFPLEKKCLEIYKLYEARKAKLYALDFDDLLLKTIQILEEFPDVRRSTAEENKHILIDEFQDTNDIQFRLLKLIMTGETNLYVVGDPDQTIYTWRGANQDIIMKLNVNFPNVETIVLDVNYRSTKKILGVANKLIAHNSNRIKKNLVTNNGEGCDVITNKSFTTKDEARWVADQIAKLKST
ncbi:MAG: UvrD-helicase domain-containing protein, partial [Bacilli bacterium]